MAFSRVDILNTLVAEQNATKLNKIFPIMEGVFKERWLKVVRVKHARLCHMKIHHFEMPNPDLIYSYTT